MAWAITSRCRFRRGPDASRSQTPPPKSAPANNTYALSDSASTAARTSARFNSGTSDTGDIHPAPFTGFGAADDLPVQQPGDNYSEEAVQQGEEQEGNDQSWHRGHRVCGAQHSLDDPGLPANLSDRPSGLDGEKAHRRSQGNGPQSPSASNHVFPAEPNPGNPERDQRQVSTQSHHHLEAGMDDRHIRPILLGELTQPSDHGVGIMEGEQRQPVRDLDCIPGLTGLRAGKASKGQGGPRHGLEMGFHCCQLDRLASRYRAGAEI